MMGIPDIDIEVITAIAAGRQWTQQDAAALEQHRAKEAIQALKAAVVTLSEQVQELADLTYGRTSPIGVKGVAGSLINDLHDLAQRLEACEQRLPAKSRPKRKQAVDQTKVCTCGENEACSLCP